MKRRLLSTLLTLCMVLTLLPGTASAALYDTIYPVTGGRIYFDSASGAIVSCDVEVTEAIIPSKINGVSVIRIETGAFWGCDSLKSVIIPDSVISIETSAFDCSNLSSVTIPSSVTSIGQGAFAGCSSLTSINVAEGNPAYSSDDGVLFNDNQTLLHTYPAGKDNSSYSIPASVTSIGEAAFYYCSSLKSVTIPNSVTSIEDSAFMSCSSLTNMTIPNSVTNIGGRAFYYCSSLKSITIPDSITTIERYTFNSCTNLTNVTIPNSVTSIGNSAFTSCISLTNVIIPNSVTTIEEYAFSGCTSLTDVIIPNSVTSIGNSAFTSCNSLAKIVIPDSMTSIAGYTFEGCSALTDIAIPSSIVNIRQGAFRWCNNLENVYYSGTEQEWNNINIDPYRDENEPLLSATIHYNSKGIPEESDPSDPPIGGEPGTATIVELSPARNATDVEFTRNPGFQSFANFEITFDREPAKLAPELNYADLDFTAGTIGLYRKSDDTLIYQAQKTEWAGDMYAPGKEGSNDVKIVYNSNIISFAVDLNLIDSDTTYYIVLDKGFIKFQDEIVNPAIAKGAWEFTTAPEEYFSTESIVVIKGDDDTNVPTPVTWDDSWFVKDSTAYNHELAATAMALSGAAYVEDAGGSPRHFSIQDALDKFDFKGFVPYNYPQSKVSNDTVAYSFAYKKVSGSDLNPVYLVAVIVKGTSGNEEWYSNFNIQTGDTHNGFNKASTELLNSLMDYLDNYGLNNSSVGTVKFLVTGHSRGAAVANLVAARLTDYAWITNTNVYGYTFATPTVSTKATETGYENIFNIISGEDFITQVPLGEWGYKHYGIDLLLPSKSYYPSYCIDKYRDGGYTAISAKMAAAYYGLLFKDFVFYKNGTQDVDDVVAHVYKLAPTVSDYYTQEHYYDYSLLTQSTTTANYFDGLASFIVNGTLNDYLNIVQSELGDFGTITNFFIKNHALNKRIFSAHGVAGYYSWLISCTAEELFGDLNSRTAITFKRVQTACPVDVYVYSENGSLVASVVNEEIGADTLAVSVEDGVKTIDLPSDQKYSIEIIATGTGSMDYTVEELSVAATGNTVLRTVNFYDLEIEADDEFKGSINDEVFTAVGNYELVKNDDEIIQADKDSLTDGNEQDPNPTPPGPSGPSQGNKPSEGDSPSESNKPSESDTPSSGGSSSGGGTSSSGGSSHGGGYTGSTSSALGNNKTSNSTESTTVTTPSSIFSDVPANHTFAAEIAWARDNGIMSGYSDSTFRPNANTNRQQMWMVLARMAGANPANMAEARTWAVNSGISDGTNPESPISRQQLIAMLYRFTKMQGMEITGTADISGYPDSGLVANYAKEAMAWAVGNGIIMGTTDGRLNPERTATRAHFAAFLYRYSSL